MNVARSQLQGLQKDAIDQIDNWRRVGVPEGGFQVLLVDRQASFLLLVFLKDDVIVETGKQGVEVDVLVRYSSGVVGFIEVVVLADFARRRNFVIGFRGWSPVVGPGVRDNILLLQCIQGRSDTRVLAWCCLLYTSPSPRDRTRSRMPSSA